MSHFQFNVLKKYDDILIHAVSSRHGGFSTGEFSSLNLGLHVNDNPDTVWKNRAAFCELLGVDAEKMITCQQVHGDNIVRVAAEDAGRGKKVYSDAIPDTDALITNEKQLPIMLFFADCTPILIADPVAGAIGVAHGGWKGTVAGIAMKTVEAMVKEFGSNPADMVAGIGPAVGPCCYEVSEDVADKFSAAFPDMTEKILLSTGNAGKYKLNLWKCNELQLLKAGLKQENVEVAGLCTSCNSQRFFSYRADKGKTGRIGALLCLR